MKAKTKLALKNYLTFPSNPAGIRSLEGLKKKCRKLLLAPAALLSSDGNPRREKAAAAPNLPRRRGAFNTWRRRGRVPRRARISTRRQRPDLPSWGWTRAGDQRATCEDGAPLRGKRVGSRWVGTR